MTDVKISDVKIWPVKNEYIKANIMFTVADAFKIKGMVRTGPTGLYVALPAKASEKVDEKTGKKIYYPDVDPVNKEVRMKMQDVILKEYYKQTGTAPNNGENQGSAGEQIDQTKPATIPFG